MKINHKAMLLSAFVIPGLGQVIKGEKLKGAILIIMVNIFLLLALFLTLQAIGPMLAAKAFKQTDPSALLDSLKSRSPAARLLLSLFFGVWIYATVDAARGKRGIP